MLPTNDNNESHSVIIKPVDKYSYEYLFRIICCCFLNYIDDDKYQHI